MKYLLCLVLAVGVSSVLASSQDEIDSTRRQQAMCFGCDTVVEYMYDEIVDAIEKHAKAAAAKKDKRLEIPIDKFVVRICQEYKLKELQGGVAAFCSHLQANWDPSIADIFQGYQNEIVQMWPKKKQICVDLYKVCPENMYHALDKQVARSLSDCQKCQMVISDIEFVMARGNPAGKNYRTKKHITGVIDDLCSMIRHRHDPEVTSVILDTCEELISDEEDAIIKAFGQGVRDMPTVIRDVCVKAADMCTEDDIKAWEQSANSDTNDNSDDNLSEDEESAPADEEEEEEDDDGHNDDEL